jgi:hypothetical protein
MKPGTRHLFELVALAGAVLIVALTVFGVRL